VLPFASRPIQPRSEEAEVRFRLGRRDFVSAGLVAPNQAAAASLGLTLSPLVMASVDELIE